MEYVADHGTFADVPVEEIVSAWKKAYGEDRMSHWIAEFEENQGVLNRNFFKEDVVKG